MVHPHSATIGSVAQTASNAAANHIYLYYGQVAETWADSPYRPSRTSASLCVSSELDLEGLLEFWSGAARFIGTLRRCLLDLLN